MKRVRGDGKVLHRLTGDRRGVSAVEFALIAPVIILFYFGLVEFCQAFMAQKRMGHVSSIVADLVAQDGTTSRDALDDIFEVGPLVMRPFSTAKLAQRVSSIRRDGSGRMVVVWSHGSRMDPYDPGEVVTDVPAGLTETEGETLVMTEATYDYDSPADYFMPSATRFEHRYYLRPRTVDSITLE